jgi:hypothetical protein
MVLRVETDTHIHTNEERSSERERERERERGNQVSRDTPYCHPNVFPKVRFDLKVDSSLSLSLSLSLSVWKPYLNRGLAHFFLPCNCLLHSPTPTTWFIVHLSLLSVYFIFKAPLYLLFQNLSLTGLSFLFGVIPYLARSIILLFFWHIHNISFPFVSLSYL